MFTISLQGVRFHAKLGIYPEEKILGNELLVDVKVCVAELGKVNSLTQTVDYEQLYQIIAAAMDEPATMLEQIIQHSADRIKSAFPHATVIEMQLRKLHPPMSGEITCSSVSLKRDFNTG